MLNDADLQAWLDQSVRYDAAARALGREFMLGDFLLTRADRAAIDDYHAGFDRYRASLAAAGVNAAEIDRRLSDIGLDAQWRLIYQLDPARQREQAQREREREERATLRAFASIVTRAFPHGLAPESPAIHPGPVTIGHYCPDAIAVRLDPQPIDQEN